MRLNKFLARTGVASRRRADLLIQSATVTVNGIVITNPAHLVEPEDVVQYGQQVLTLPEETIVLLLHKPRGVLTTVRDPRQRRTVVDLIPSHLALFPVGRLDRDTQGLLLFTNDGHLAQRLIHPRHQIPRVYQVVTDRPLDSGSIRRLGAGIPIGAGETGRARVLKQVRVKGRTKVTLELRQGRKREIRRLFRKLKRPVIDLIRTRFGSLSLGKLPVGDWRRLSARETQHLRRYLEGKRAPEKPLPGPV